MIDRARDLLRGLNLPSDPLTRAIDGEDNLVFLGPAHVVRICSGWQYDHRREVPPSERARSLGVSAPKFLAAGEDFSVWERLPGTNLWRAPIVREEFWSGLIADLVTLHTVPAPPDAVEPDLDPFLHLVPELPGLTELERGYLAQIEEPEGARLTFSHADIHGGNVIVSPDGGYGGIIDWADGGWWRPEIDYCLLELDILNELLAAPPEPLVWPLVAHHRLRVGVRLVHLGLWPIEKLRDSIQFAKQVGL